MRVRQPSLITPRSRMTPSRSNSVTCSSVIRVIFRPAMSILRSHPGPRTLRDIFGLMAAQAGGIGHSYRSVMRGPSPMSAAERELIYRFCAHLNGCDYAYTSHSACATALGIAPAVFRAMKNGSPLPIRPQLKPILRFARKLTLKPSTITPADARRIYAAGWPEQALIDTIVVTSLTAW